MPTRAGRWLIGVTVGLALLANVIFLIVAATYRHHRVLVGDFVAVSVFVSSVLLPVLGIMLVTSEWSQRTAMTTFTLEPRRMRIVLAKMLAGVALDGVRDRLRPGRGRDLQPAARHDA